MPIRERSTWTRTATFFLPEEGARFIASVRSNAQNGNVTPIFDQTTQVNLGGDLIQGGINGIGLCGQTFVAVDRSGTATNNNVYVMASVIPFSASNGTDVMFARSTDGGATFSAPHRINDDPINQNKWHYLRHAFSSTQWTHRCGVAGHPQRS